MDTWHLVVNKNNPTHKAWSKSRHMISAQPDFSDSLSCQASSCLWDFVLLFLSIYTFLSLDIPIVFLCPPPFFIWVFSFHFTHFLLSSELSTQRGLIISLSLNEFLYFPFMIYGLSPFYFLHRTEYYLALCVSFH